MRRVEDILASKASRTVHTIAPSASVYEAMRIMEKERIGGLLVMQGTELVGIVTERDFARKIALRARKSHQTPVRDVMSSPVVTVSPSHTSDDCLVIMARCQIRHLPVVDEAAPVGMISVRDLVDEIVADRRLLELEQVRPPSPRPPGAFV